MLDITPFTTCFEDVDYSSLEFTPLQIDLNRFVAGLTIEEEVEEDFVTEFESVDVRKIRALSSTRTMISIDGTSHTLGFVDDGVMGATRVSVIERNLETEKVKISFYGPYIGLFTNQNKDHIYQKLHREVLENPNITKSPDTSRMVDRIRNFLEKRIQLEIVRNYRDSLILFDGSLIGGTIDSPKSFMKKILVYAAKNNNDIVAVSKNTKLVLKHSQRSILSLLDAETGPCYCEITPQLGERKKRYLGKVYVAKLAPMGEAFRIDLSETNSTDPERLLSEIIPTVTQIGYPRDLKLAHIHCILSSIEVLELQAAAMSKFRMNLKQDIRQKVFSPWR